MYSVLYSVLAVIKFVHFCVVLRISGCRTRLQNVTEHSVELQNQFFFDLLSAFSEFKDAYSEASSDTHLRSHSICFRFVSWEEYDSDVIESVEVSALVRFIIPL